MAISRRLTTLDEFALEKNMRPEELSGFRTWLEGRRCATDEEWDALHSQYQNRTLCSRAR